MRVYVNFILEAITNIFLLWGVIGFCVLRDKLKKQHLYKLQLKRALVSSILIVVYLLLSNYIKDNMDKWLLPIVWQIGISFALHIILMLLIAIMAAWSIVYKWVELGQEK